MKEPERDSSRSGSFARPWSFPWLIEESSLNGTAFGPAIRDRPSAGLNATFARPIGLAQAGAWDSALRCPTRDDL